MKKEYKCGDGIILVRQSDSKQGGCGIVEMLYLPDGKSGCVIGQWGERRADNSRIAEFSSIHARFIEQDYNEFDIFEALRYGQKLSEIILA